MLLADSHITMVVGVDVHVTTAPLQSHPPYMGMVMDPADYIPFLGTNVSVNGLKRGVSDTGRHDYPLMHIRLPDLSPWLRWSGTRHELFASQTVFCDGSRMSPKGHMVMTCNDVGIPLSAGIGKNKAGKTRLIPSLSPRPPFPSLSPRASPSWWAALCPRLGRNADRTCGEHRVQLLMNSEAKGQGTKKFNHKVLKNTNIQKRFPRRRSWAHTCAGTASSLWTSLTGCGLRGHGLASRHRFRWNGAGHGTPIRSTRAGWAMAYTAAMTARWKVSRTRAWRCPHGGRLCRRFPADSTGRRVLHAHGTHDAAPKKGYEAYSHDSLLTYRFDMRDERGVAHDKHRKPTGFIYSSVSATAGSPGERPCRTQRYTPPPTRRDASRARRSSPAGEERLVSYTYDESGNMTGITDAMDKTTEMSYSGHLMTEKTDRNGDTYAGNTTARDGASIPTARTAWWRGIEYHPSGRLQPRDRLHGRHDHLPHIARPAWRPPRSTRSATRRATATHGLHGALPHHRPPRAASRATVTTMTATSPVSRTPTAAADVHIRRQGTAQHPVGPWRATRPSACTTRDVRTLSADS